MKNIRLIVLDVDGVLTDGKLLLSSSGEEVKAFHVHDGMGISLAKFVGIEVAIITGRRSAAVEKRAAELNINYVQQGVKDKVSALLQLAGEIDIDVNQMCYIGDDLNDIEAMNMVGLAACPANAIEEVKQEAEIVAERMGGNGAVREIIESILRQSFDYTALVKDFLNQQAVRQ
ncbi:HAD-IIIA family hydrolase [Cytobacillus sp. FSL W7-1323]|uniref:KdsC family phosphatase n=1 Tax=Cytobacillus TaxID=2675230 RepID=UPI002787849E|nr:MULTISPECIES: HAD-IIIA family hydrolase [Cytobacillus]MDQ0185729.1 3-deoxy-D-manno-octulosonate 8-phosphate phosphatase (KDO 8-P phosphatase) [Cytobacillus kochii]MEA1853471.1 HAD-IIIA family hydrolase [Cytobacillus sp. OWB-43]